MKLQNEGFKRYWHPQHQSAIAFKKGTWIGFDDPDGARVKCEYVVREGLNGAMFWYARPQIFFFIKIKYYFLF